MFLLERGISLLLYALVLFGILYILKRIKARQVKALMIIYLIILAIFAFNYKPYITSDLFRLREYILYWTNKSWGDVIIYAFNRSDSAWVLYAYLVNKLGNTNLLQTIACIWCFGNIFYMVSDLIKIQNLRYNKRVAVLFYVMAVGAMYLQAISGIRTMLGISIVSVCLYREYFHGKKFWCDIPLYLVAGLFHSAVFIVVIVRIVLLVFEQKEISKKIFAAIILLIGVLFVYKYANNIFNDVFSYGTGYLKNKNEYTYIWETLIGIIEIIQIILVLRYYKKNVEFKFNSNMYRCCILWLVVSVITLPFSYAIFRRYTMFTTIISTPLLAQVIGNNQDDLNKFSFLHRIIMLSGCIFVLSLLRGDLCGYKFFVLS